MDSRWIDEQKEKRNEMIQRAIQRQRDEAGGHLDWRQEKFLEQIFRERLERMDAMMTEASEAKIERMRLAMKAAVEQGGTIKVEDEEKTLKSSPS